MKLFPYQEVGVEFLKERQHALIADDMGLGKTAQLIKSTEGLGKVLIICPNAVKENWAREIIKWIPGSTPLILPKDPKLIDKMLELFPNEQYCIVNYEQIISRNYNTLMTDADGNNSKFVLSVDGLHKDLAKHPWKCLILDEAHRIKNRQSSTYRAVKDLSLYTPRIYLSTGTPILNRVSELWTLLNVMYPKHYTSYWRFCKQYCRVVQGRYGFQVEDYGFETPQIKDLIASLSNKMIRRTKAEVLPDLPPKTIVPIWVDMEGPQRKLYDKMEEEMLVELESMKTVIAPIAIAKIIRLKQLAISPLLLGENKLYGAKLTALYDLLEDIPGSVVIFSQFKNYLPELQKALLKINKTFTSELITGDVPINDRNRLIDDFQAGKYKILLGSTQAIKEGINLTKASVGVFMDKLWTPSLNTQAQDRLHRIGQLDNVLIYELLAKSSVEEDIELLLARKQQVINMVVEDPASSNEFVADLMQRMRDRVKK